MATWSTTRSTAWTGPIPRNRRRSKATPAPIEAGLPRQGKASFTSGPKIVNFDRVEWHIIPDAATAAAALQSGEMDWWEQPTIDLQPLLRKARDLVVDVIDPTGVIGTLRFNTL